MSAPYRYEEMLPAQFEAALEKMPVMILPCGLLEWHGDHLPLGQDGLKAHGICCAAAEALGGGIVLPVNWWGRPGFSNFVGTLTFSEEALRPLFTEIFEQLVKVGARVILLVTGHYGDTQVNFVKSVAADFAGRHPDVRVIAQPEYEGVEIDGEQPANHAGKWETSMFSYLYPDLTHMENFRVGKETVSSYEDRPYTEFRCSPEREWTEDLRETASPELGKRCIDVIARHLAGKVRAALAEFGV